MCGDEGSGEDHGHTVLWSAGRSALASTSCMALSLGRLCHRGMHRTTRDVGYERLRREIEVSVSPSRSMRNPPLSALVPPPLPACTLAERRFQEVRDFAVLVIDRDAMPGMGKNLYRNGHALRLQLLHKRLGLLDGHPLILRPMQ